AALDREWRRRFGIRSTLTVPLSTGRAPVFGMLTFSTTRAERAWTGDLVQQLQFVGQLCSHALARKRSDEALRESEQRLKLATDAAGIGLWSMDLTTGRIWVNARLRRLFTVGTGEDLTYLKFRELIHPDDRETVHEAVKHAWERDAPL